MTKTSAPSLEYIGDLIIETQPDRPNDNSKHKRISSFPAHIGRGYHNDFILTDEHISASHIKIDSHTQNSWVLTDMESENGVYINGKKHRGGTAHITSGDKVTIGKTTLRFLSEYHPINKTEKITLTHGIRNIVTKPFVSALLFITVIPFLIIWSYFENWSDSVGEDLAFTAASIVIVVLIWSALWSVAGRLIKHRSFFNAHISLACLYLLFVSVGDYVQEYIDFFLLDNSFSQIISGIVQFILLAGLIYGSLGLATKRNRRKRFWQGTIISACVILGVLSFSAISKQKFNERPQYSYGIKPHLTEFINTQSSADFLKDSKKFFEKAQFNSEGE